LLATLWFWSSFFLSRRQRFIRLYAILSLLDCSLLVFKDYFIQFISKLSTMSGKQ
jgi:uncharacterized membrane protein